MAPEHESAFSLQEPIQHFWSANRHIWNAKLPSCGLWPNGLRVMIRHPFRPFRKRMCTDSNPNRPYLFLESSVLYK